MRSKVKEDKMNRNRLLNKYLLLALILTALFAMTGCRTRITNNSEVSNVYYDEDGFLSETYQMRRDELGLSTAESPIFPDLGSGDTEDDFDSSEEPGLNYEPEEDTYVEPPTTSTTTTSSSSGRRYSSSGRRYSSPSSSGSGSRSSTTTKVKITFDPGKGHIGSKKAGETATEEFTKNSTFKTITASRDGYKLKEWKPSDGSKSVGVGVEVKATKDLKYTAVWEEEPTKPAPTPERKVTVDTKGGTLSGEIKNTYKKGDSFNLPGCDRDDGFTLVEWNVNGETKEVGKSVSVGDKDLKITASKWTGVPSYWDESIDSVEKDKKYYSEEEESLFTQCIGEHVDSLDADYDYAVAFAKNLDAAKKAKKKLTDSGIDEAKVRIFSKPPGSGDGLILYKLRLFNAIYDNDLGIGKVEEATGLDSGDYFEEFNTEDS